MSKPRVCMLIDLFYPVLDGTGLQALRLARQLTEKQFPVMVVARRSEKHFFPKEHLDDILIYRLLPAGRRTHRVVLLQMVPVVWFLLRHHRKYDLVHVHEARSLLVCALVVRLLFRKPVMALVPTYGDVSRQASQSTRISTYSKILRRFLLPQRLWRALLRQVDVWVALSSEIEDELGQLGLGEKVRRIPNGIDLSLFHPSTPDFHPINFIWSHMDGWRSVNGWKCCWRRWRCSLQITQRLNCYCLAG
jgi:glycosyltransferase involved in cell wall biosynthesis